MSARTRVRRLLRRLGYDVTLRRPTLADLLRQRGVDVVLDVGANQGQFALGLRAWGWGGRVVSFEPLPAALDVLRARAASDPGWDVAPVALGDAAGTAALHVSELDVFSSLRRPLPAAEAFDRRARTVRTVDVDVRRLDDVFDDWVQPSKRAFLKIDTQGHEGAVLDGAVGVLDRVEGVQLELGVSALYDGEHLAPAMISRMADAGFRIAQVLPVVYDPADGFASLMQLDAVFVRPPG